MAEKFDIKKWLGGFIDPTTWSKSIVYFAMIAVILVVGFTIYRAYFMKTGSNVNRPAIITFGGSGDINVTSEQKVEEKKREENKEETGGLSDLLARLKQFK